MHSCVVRRIRMASKSLYQQSTSNVHWTAARFSAEKPSTCKLDRNENVIIEVNNGVEQVLVIRVPNIARTARALHPPSPQDLSTRDSLRFVPYQSA